MCSTRQAAVGDEARQRHHETAYSRHQKPRGLGGGTDEREDRGAAQGQIRRKQGWPENTPHEPREYQRVLDPSHRSTWRLAILTASR